MKETTYLVFYKQVLIAPKEERQPQRHSLFKTSCTIQGKICNVIIDSGNNGNFVSKRLVAALNLKVEPHPNSYKIRWIKKGGKVQNGCMSYTLGNAMAI
ncbi:zf-CCHC domain-containing protein [Cucumis melo var. makuwa]|uniref:Zf-CCHC domain-containing protein n=1 Tax=Cucumis melo var. makuwa TaxID=1194695 RepID=A0A5A7USG6_CUCMM|nr:zf-CCHC domain-containing protein [Cucumis melo var. makuwa]